MSSFLLIDKQNIHQTVFWNILNCYFCKKLFFSLFTLNISHFAAAPSFSASLLSVFSAQLVHCLMQSVEFCCLASPLPKPHEPLFKLYHSFIVGIKAWSVSWKVSAQATFKTTDLIQTKQEISASSINISMKQSDHFRVLLNTFLGEMSCGKLTVFPPQHKHTPRCSV